MSRVPPGTFFNQRHRWLADQATSREREPVNAKWRAATCARSNDSPSTMSGEPATDMVQPNIVCPEATSVCHWGDPTSSVTYTSTESGAIPTASIRAERRRRVRTEKWPSSAPATHRVSPRWVPALRNGPCQWPTSPPSTPAQPSDPSPDREEPPPPASKPDAHARGSPEKGATYQRGVSQRERPKIDQHRNQEGEQQAKDTCRL